MRQIVYFSTASGRQDRLVTDAILAVSRVRNLQDGITGLLVAGGFRYLQLIEGPPAAMHDLLRRLRADNGHLAMTVLVDHRVRARAFDGWSMAHVEAPALAKFATLRDLAEVLLDLVANPGLRDRIEGFVDAFAIVPPPPEWPALAVDCRH